MRRNATQAPTTRLDGWHLARWARFARLAWRHAGGHIRGGDRARATSPSPADGTRIRMARIQDVEASPQVSIWGRHTRRSAIAHRGLVETYPTAERSRSSPIRPSTSNISRAQEYSSCAPRETRCSCRSVDSVSRGRRAQCISAGPGCGYGRTGSRESIRVRRDASGRRELGSWGRRVAVENY